MTPKLKKWLRWMVRCILALILAILAVWAFAPQILVLDSGPVPADAIIVLGGEPWTRPTRAAEVFKESHPFLIIVSGEGDCQDVRRKMESLGVPHELIETECKSRSTYENAAFSIKLLRERQITNVVLVTSWYHSRRALACFQQAAPEIQFRSRPTHCPPAGARRPDSYIAKRVFQEYSKIIYYWLVHGVTPWC